MTSRFEHLQNIPETRLVEMMTHGMSNRMVIWNCLAGHPDDKGALTDPRLQKYVADIRAKYELHTRNGAGFTTEDLRTAVANAICISDVLRALDLKPHGGNLKTVKNLITAYEIDTSHFDVSAAMRRNKTSWTKEAVFCKDSKAHRSTLAHYVDKYKILTYACETCGNTGEWNGKELRLIVDHKDGVNDNNQVDNLRYLCPNCHAQTSTFGGKNK